MYVTAFFTKNFTPEIGLSPELDIYRLSDNHPVVAGGIMTPVGGGYYKYNFSAYDALEEYVIVADGGASLDPVERYKYNGSAEADIKLNVAIKERTDNLPNNPAASGDLMGLIDDAITSNKYDESTAFPLRQDDVGDTEVARVGADGDTLETLSDQIDGVSTFDPASDEVNIGKVKGIAVTGVSDFRANVSLLAIEANVEGHVTDALNTYDPPTRTEATADKDEVIAAMPSVADIDIKLSDEHGYGSWETGAGKDWTDGEKEQIRDALGVDGTKTAAVGGQIQSIKDDIKRLLGLDHENIFIDNTAYDADEQLVSARVRLFDSKAHCDAATDGGSETAGLIATYALTTNWEAINKFRIFKQTRE